MALKNINKYHTVFRGKKTTRLRHIIFPAGGHLSGKFGVAQERAVCDEDAWTKNQGIP